MSANALTETGGTLRDRRTQAGVTQQTLAQLAECSVSMVRLLERGYQPPHSPIHERIVAVLDALTPQTKRAPDPRPERVRKIGDDRTVNHASD